MVGQGSQGPLAGSVCRRGGVCPCPAASHQFTNLPICPRTLLASSCCNWRRDADGAPHTELERRGRRGQAQCLRSLKGSSPCRRTASTSGDVAGVAVRYAKHPSLAPPSPDDLGGALPQPFKLTAS